MVPTVCGRKRDQDSDNDCASSDTASIRQKVKHSTDEKIQAIPDELSRLTNDMRQLDRQLQSFRGELTLEIPFLQRSRAMMDLEEGISDVRQKLHTF